MGSRPPPDPLGKRALFWWPGEEEAPPPSPSPWSLRAPGDRATRESAASGKRALFSVAEPAKKRSGPASGEPSTGERPRHPSSGSTGAGGGVAGPDGGGGGPFAVTCSACGSKTSVGLVELLALHAPIFAVVPLRRFDHWMRCPACGRRTWTGVARWR